MRGGMGCVGVLQLAACVAAWVVWGCYNWAANGGLVEPRRHWGRPWAPEENQWEYGGAP